MKTQSHSNFQLSAKARFSLSSLGLFASSTRLFRPSASHFSIEVVIITSLFRHRFSFTARVKAINHESTPSHGDNTLPYGGTVPRCFIKMGKLRGRELAVMRQVKRLNKIMKFVRANKCVFVGRDSVIFLRSAQHILALRLSQFQAFGLMGSMGPDLGFQFCCQWIQEKIFGVIMSEYFLAIASLKMYLDKTATAEFMH